MPRILRFQILVSSFTALLSCVYVYFFGSFADRIAFRANIGGYTPAVASLISYQKYALIVPLMGLLVAIAFPKFKRVIMRYLFFVPDLLYLFALAWIFFAMLAWLALFSARIGAFLHGSQ